MIASAALLWAAALVAAGFSVRHGRRALTAALDGLRLSLSLAPRLLLALIAAGFIERLVPADQVALLIGGASGLTGILIASLAGGCIPAGPMVSFPLVLILANGGAGTPQLIAFVTGWATLALHRVIAFEIPLLGARFAALRLLVSLPVPVLCGLLAAAFLALAG